MASWLSRTANAFQESSSWAKVLFFLMVFLVVATIFKKRPRREGFEENAFSFKGNVELYDDFYVDIYDNLVFDNLRDDYTIAQIVNKTTPTTESIILDVGSGTGQIVNKLAAKNFKVIGVDSSRAMVQKAQENFPSLNFEQGDVAAAELFDASSFTHILCTYFTIYYIEDKVQFFDNCIKWLMPGGSLVVHIVDRDKYDPIIPAANPLLMLSPQRYAKERITSYNVTFHKFKYNGKMDYDNNTNRAKLSERFVNKASGKVFRKQEHTLYMESEDAILALAKAAGFIVQGKIDLVKVGYEYQYMYLFQKPQ